MKFHNWLHQCNEDINQAIAICFNNRHIGGWQENHITTQVLEAVEKIGKEFDWEEYPQRVRWEAYKLNGNLEHAFGDIALFARVWLSEDRFLDGVAFYEAKRQYYKETGEPAGFSSVKKEQLSRLSSSTHASQVLFYDADAEKSQVCVTSVPTVFVKELAEVDLVATSGRLIHRYGNSWIISLGNNFRGFGLDFRPESIAAVKSAAESHDAPSVILNIGVGMTHLIEPKLDTYCASLNQYEAWLVPNVEESPSQSPNSRSDFMP